MTIELKIEKGIPSPTLKNELMGLIKKMQNGDSVFFDELSKARSFYATMTKNKLRATCGKVDGGYRVWKLGTKGETNGKETS